MSKQCWHVFVDNRSTIKKIISEAFPNFKFGKQLCQTQLVATHKKNKNLQLVAELAYRSDNMVASGIWISYEPDELDGEIKEVGSIEFSCVNVGKENCFRNCYGCNCNRIPSLMKKTFEQGCVRLKE